MRQRYGTLAVVAAALIACSSDDGATGTQLADVPTGPNPDTAAPGGDTMAPGQAGPADPTPGNTGTEPAPGNTGTEPAPGDTGGAGMDGATDPGMDDGSGDDPAGDDPAGDDPPTASAGCGPATTHSAAELGDTNNLGPFTPAHVENTGPNGSSWVYHPQELGMDGMVHPVFQWGPGAGTGPSNYLDHLNLLASHGFVIISQASTQSGKEALDWILAENESEGSMWHQKLDSERVGRGGHSMGALQSFSEADDPRLKLYVLVCGGANGGSGAANIDDPAIFLGGQGLSDTSNFEPDYAETTGPTVFIRHTDTDHIFCARDNLGPWVAFMRWQFCGEDQWKQEFEPGGTYCMGEWAACETKNL